MRLVLGLRVQKGDETTAQEGARAWCPPYVRKVVVVGALRDSKRNQKINKKNKKE